MIESAERSTLLKGVTPGSTVQRRPAARWLANAASALRRFESANNNKIACGGTWRAGKIVQRRDSPASQGKRRRFRRGGDPRGDEGSASMRNFLRRRLPGSSSLGTGRRPERRQ